MLSFKWNISFGSRTGLDFTPTLDDLISMWIFSELLLSDVPYSRGSRKIFEIDRENPGFLVHLINHVASIGRARFVAAGAIDPKLCRYVPLGKSNSQAKFRSSLILRLATRGAKPKT
jgi:hypothetical protein